MSRLSRRHNIADGSYSRRHLCHGSIGDYCAKLNCFGRHGGNKTNSSAADLQTDWHTEPITHANMLTSSIDSFKEYFEHQRNSDSLYHKLLKDWLKFIRRDQLFIVSMDNLLANTTSVLGSIAKFLNLPVTLASGDIGSLFLKPDNNTLPRLMTPIRDLKHNLECDCETYDAMKMEFDTLKIAEKTLKIINESAVSSEGLIWEPLFNPFGYQRTCADNVSSSTVTYNEVA
jgi:hypothetical protein